MYMHWLLWPKKILESVVINEIFFSQQNKIDTKSLQALSKYIAQFVDG